MKQIFLIILSALASLSLNAQGVIELKSGKLMKEYVSTIPARDIIELADGYLITYNFEKASILSDELFPGTVFWKMDGFNMNQISTEPSTLFREDRIVIPEGYDVKVELTDSTYIDFDYELTPARQPLVDSDNEKYTKQNVLPISPYEGFRPENIVFQTETQKYRGQSICQTAISPIQYNYNTKTVRAYTSITYKVSFIPQNTGKAINKTLPTRLSLEDGLLNSIAIGGNFHSETCLGSGTTALSDIRDYLIISTNTYADAVNRFAEWKRLLGFNVHTVLRDNWTDTSVMSTITDAYANYPALYYLLIIGDNDDVPAQQSSLISTHITDFHYSCMDNDFLPDIYCGRISASSESEASTIVDKIITYEQTPPTDSDFYTHSLHCAYFQDKDFNGYADRRFAETSEDVRTYIISQGIFPYRVYKTESNVTPLYWNNTLYSNGESVPNELRKPGFAWDGNYADINSAINNGVFYVLHRDHGSVSSWGKPQYTQSNISSLSNANLLPVVFSMNCLTGKFDSTCFAETFLRKPNGGCVAIYGATEESYSGYNDALTTGMFDAIWPNPGLCINIPNRNNTFSVTPTPTYTLGQILAQGKIRLAETYGSNNNYTKYTDEIFHCFGDPSMRIYTQVPTAFNNVSVIRNQESIYICLASGDSARITTYDPITGDIQSFLGSTVTISTSNPSETIVCVSGHNRIPFIQYPDVMYIQNLNLSGTLNETHDSIKVGNHVTSTIETGDVTTSNADITLRAREIILDKGTYISTGTTLKTVIP